MLENIIFWVGFFALWAAVVRYDIHMFQHNSYRVARYARWYRSGQNRLRPILIAAIVAIFFLPFISGLVFACVASVIMLALGWREFSTTYKKPLVYTKRVIRLIATSAIITLIVIALSLLYIPTHAPIIALGLLILPIVMLLANLLNNPLEAAITRWYYNDAKRILQSMPDLKIIGITGSFGKTSTKHYLYRILSEKYNVLMTPGNFNTTLGVVRTIREHLKPHHQVFIVEMGAKQTGDIKEICDLVHPSIGIVTAVGEMHLETFHSVENIRRTKLELIDALPESGYGVVNLDSEYIANKPIDHKSHLITYGVKNHDADYRAVNIDYSAAETSLTVDTRGDLREAYTTHLAGRGNILNLLAAVAVADVMGVSIAHQKRAMRQIEQIEHRLSVKRTAGGVTIIDDAYNSNPTGAKMALEVLANFNRPVTGRRIVVTPGFVELGERQAQLNQELGRDIAEAADLAIVVNYTNREAICAGLREAEFDAEKIICSESFAEASSYLAGTLRAGDVILYENDLPDSFK